MREQRVALGYRCNASDRVSLAAGMVVEAVCFFTLRHMVGRLLLILISAARGMIWPAARVGWGAFADFLPGLVKIRSLRKPLPEPVLGGLPEGDGLDGPGHIHLHLERAFILERHTGP